jgi:YD repeat-containing protein
VKYCALYFCIIVLASETIMLPGHAAETISYTYDALGRLVATTKSGTINNGVTTNITLDAAGNRTNYQVAGVIAPITPRLVIVPLNGYTIIPIP